MANSDEKKGKKTSGGVRAFFRNLVGMPPIESDLENTPQELKGDIQAQAGESVFVVQSNSELHQMHYSVLDEDSLEVKLKQKKSEKVISVANVLLGGGAVVFNSDYEKELVVKLLQENQLLFKETNGVIKLEQGQTLPTQLDFSTQLKDVFVNPGNAADNKSILEAVNRDETKMGAEQPPVAPKTSNVATSSATANQIPVAIPNKPSSTQAERKAGATSDYSRVMNLLNQEIRAKTNLSGEAEELKIHLTNQNSIQRRINGQNLTTDQVLKEIDVYVKFNDDNPNLPQATKVLMLRLALKVKEPLVNPPNPTPDNRSKISDELKARWEQPKSAAAEAKAGNKETNPSVSGNAATATTASVADPSAPTKVRRPLVKLQGVNNTASPVNNPNIGRPLPTIKEGNRPGAQRRDPNAPKMVRDPNATKAAVPENWKKNQAVETADKEANPSVQSPVAGNTTNVPVANPNPEARVRRPLVKPKDANNTASPVNNPNIGRPLPIIKENNRPSTQRRDPNAPKMVRDPNATKAAVPESWKKNQAAETANKEANPSVQSPVRKPETAEPVAQSSAGNKIEEGLIRLRDSGTTPKEKEAAQKKAASMKGLVQVLLETGIPLDANSSNYTEESKKATQLCQAILSDRKTTVVDVLEEVRIQLEKNKDNPQEQVKILARSQFMLNTLMNLNLTDKFKKDVGLDDLRIEVVLGKKELNNNEVKQKFKEVEDMLPEGLKNGLREKLKQNLKQEVFIAPPLEQGEQKLVSVDKLMKKVGKGEQKNFNKSVEQMASDIMVNSTERYLKIKEDDLYEKGWETVGADNNLRAMDDGINKITHNLVAVSVIKGTNDITEMARRANFWVKVAEKLLEKGDYPSAMAISAVIQSAELPPDVLKSPKFKQKELDNVNAQLSSAKNNEVYRKAIVDRKEYIPLTSISQQELLLNAEGNPRINDQHKILNTYRLEVQQGALQNVVAQSQNENLLRSVREKAAPKFDLAAVFKEPTLTDKEVIAIRIARVEIAEKGSLAAKGGQGSTLGEVYGQLLEVGKRTLEVSTFEGFTAERDMRQDKIKPEQINLALLKFVQEKLVADKTGNSETYEMNRGYAAGIINFVEQYAKKNKVQLNADTNDLIVKLKEEHNLKDVAIPVAVQKGEGVRVQANASVSPTIVTPTVATTVTAQPQPQPQAQQPVAQGFKTAEPKKAEGQEQPVRANFGSAAGEKVVDLGAESTVKAEPNESASLKKLKIKEAEVYEELGKYEEYLDYLLGKMDEDKQPNHLEEIANAKSQIEILKSEYHAVNTALEEMKQKEVAQKIPDVSATPTPVRPTTAAPNTAPQKPTESSYTFPSLMDQKTKEAWDSWVAILAIKITKGEALKFSNPKDVDIVSKFLIGTKLAEGKEIILSGRDKDKNKPNDVLQVTKKNLIVDKIKSEAVRMLPASEEVMQATIASPVVPQQEVPVASTVIPIQPAVVNAVQSGLEGVPVATASVVVPQQTVPVVDAEKAAKNAFKIMMVAGEVVSTEETYLEVAKTFFEKVYNPKLPEGELTFKQKLTQLSVKGDDLDHKANFLSFLSNYEKSMATSAEVIAKSKLLEEFVKAKQEKRAPVGLPENFSPDKFLAEELEPALKAHMAVLDKCIEEFPSFLDASAALSKNKEFDKLISEMNALHFVKDPVVQSISSATITTVQRIPRYQLFAREFGGFEGFPNEEYFATAAFKANNTIRDADNKKVLADAKEALFNKIKNPEDNTAAKNYYSQLTSFLSQGNVEANFTDSELKIVLKNINKLNSTYKENNPDKGPNAIHIMKTSLIDERKALETVGQLVSLGCSIRIDAILSLLDDKEKGITVSPLPEKMRSGKNLLNTLDAIVSMKEKHEIKVNYGESREFIAYLAMELNEAKASKKPDSYEQKLLEMSEKAFGQKFVEEIDQIVISITPSGPAKPADNAKELDKFMWASAVVSDHLKKQMGITQATATEKNIHMIPKIDSIDTTEKMRTFLEAVLILQQGGIKLDFSDEFKDQSSKYTGNNKLKDLFAKIDENMVIQKQTGENKVPGAFDVKSLLEVEKNAPQNEEKDKKEKINKRRRLGQTLDAAIKPLRSRQRESQQTEPLATNAVALDISGPTVVPYFHKPVDTNNAERMRNWASDVVKHYFKIDAQLPPTITQEKALIAINPQELKLLAEAMVFLKKNGTQFNIPEGSKFADQLLDFGMKHTSDDLNTAVNIRILLTPNSPTATATATNTNTNVQPQQPSVEPSVASTVNNPSVVVTQPKSPVPLTPPSLVTLNTRERTGFPLLLKNAQNAAEEYLSQKQNQNRRTDSAVMGLLADMSAIQIRNPLTHTQEQKRQALEQLLNQQPPKPGTEGITAFIVGKLGNDLKVLPQPTQPNNRPLNTLAQRPLPPSSIPPDVTSSQSGVSGAQPVQQQPQPRPRTNQPPRRGVVPERSASGVDDVQPQRPWPPKPASQNAASQSVVTSPSQPPVWSQRHRSSSVTKVFNVEGNHLETFRQPERRSSMLSDYVIVHDNQNSVEFKPTINALRKMSPEGTVSSVPINCVATYTPGIGNNSGTTSYDMKPGGSFQTNESDALLAFLVKKAFDAHLENPATKDKKLVITVLQDMSEPKQEVFVKMVKEEAQKRVNDGTLNKDNIEVKKKAANANEPEVSIPIEIKPRVNVARK